MKTLSHPIPQFLCTSKELENRTCFKFSRKIVVCGNRFVWKLISYSTGSFRQQSSVDYHEMYKNNPYFVCSVYCTGCVRHFVCICV